MQVEGTQPLPAGRRQCGPPERAPVLQMLGSKARSARARVLGVWHEHHVTREGSGWGRTSAGQTRRCGGKAVWCWDGRQTVGGHELCSCWRGQQKRSKRSVTTRRTCYASRSARADLPGDRTMPTSFCPGSPAWLPSVPCLSRRLAFDGLV